MMIWPFLFLSLALAQNASVEEYCFSSSVKMKQVSQRLKFIMVPADKIEENERCFTVSTPEHRRELIQNYVRNLAPNVQISFSSAEIKREPCHIKVEKIKKKISDSTEIGVNPQIEFNAQKRESNSTSTDTSKIQTLKEFGLTVNQDSIKGECRFINPNLYEIKIEVTKEAIPLIPPVPPGTVVIIPNAEVPKTQETAHLSTTLQLTRGQRIEIGSVVKQMRNGANKIDLNSGAGIDQAADQANETVFLSLD